MLSFDVTFYCTAKEMEAKVAFLFLKVTHYRIEVAFERKIKRAQMKLVNESFANYIDIFHKTEV